MSLEAGRVGVRPDQVDAYGRINPNTSFLDKIIDKLITWVDLPVWKGGTEQLLPENDDEPETSPILCDIDYSDQEREDQYFTYRESPTTSDGIAKIESIRGNTLVWNQLNKDNFTDATKFYAGANSLSVSGNVLTITVSAVDTSSTMRQNPAITLTVGHKYLYVIEVNPSRAIKLRWLYNGSSTDANDYIKDAPADTWTSYYSICTIQSNYADALYYNVSGTLEENDTVKFRNYILVDLTLLGSSVITDYTSFKSYFPLSYYKYDAGSLLNFTADKIKTTGKNLLELKLSDIKTVNTTGTWADNVYTYNDLKFTVTDVISVKGTSSADTLFYIQINLPTNNYYFSGCADGGSNTKWDVFVWDSTTNSRIKKWDKTNNSDSLFNSTTKAEGYVIEGHNIQYRIRIRASQNVNLVFKPMFIFSDADLPFEPYTTNTLELPISDFFPTGMKSACEVYDELLPRRATTNVGDVDLGSLTWIYSSAEGHERFESSGLASVLKNVATNKKPNILCSKYDTDSADNIYVHTKDKVIGYNQDKTLWVYDSTADTDASAFKTAMSGVMLNYELAQPIVEPTLVFND